MKVVSTFAAVAFFGDGRRSGPEHPCLRLFFLHLHSVSKVHCHVHAAWRDKDKANRVHAVAAGLLWGASHFGVGADGAFDFSADRDRMRPQWKVNLMSPGVLLEIASPL